MDPNEKWLEAGDPFYTYRPGEASMVFLNGSSRAFRCEFCTCNVFASLPDEVYVCNGCGARYQGS